MLYLIGLGLYDEKDVTLRGLETAKSCQEVYIELYTSKWLGKANLEKLLGRKIVELERKDLEEGSAKIIEEARMKDIAILVPGDPLSATTHIILVSEAQQKGVDIRIVHAPSIFSAVAATGLSLYKFGKTCTIPREQDGYAPTSFYDVIVENLRTGSHTLVLLDIGDSPMTVREALERLDAAEKEHKKGVMRADMMLVAAHFGETETILYTDSAKLQTVNLPTPSVLVVPADLNDVEKELLESKR